MTAHRLEAPKGWPSPHAVDYAAVFDPTDLATIQAAGREVWAGRCVHATNTGYKYGVTGMQMPMFLFNSSDDPDVSNQGGDPATVAGAWVAVAPTGKMMALPAKGAYELATTEFDTTATYNLNEPLYSATGTDADDGKLNDTAGDAGTYPDETIVGIVSRNRTPTSPANSHGVAELFFWPVFLPGHTHS